MDEKNGVEVSQEQTPPEENPQQNEELTPDGQASQEAASGEPAASSDEVAVDSDPSAEAGDDASVSEAVIEKEASDDLRQSEDAPENVDGAPGESSVDQDVSGEAGNEPEGNGLLSQEDIDKAIQESGGEIESEDESMSQDDMDAGSGSSDEADFFAEDRPPVKQADFQQLSSSAQGEGPRNIDLLMDVDLPVSIELGRTRMNIADILALGPGSVVELEKLVGEPVDLLVNHRCVARGEVVVVEENFGLRITQLVSPEERIKNLQ